MITPLLLPLGLLMVLTRLLKIKEKKIIIKIGVVVVVGAGKNPAAVAGISPAAVDVVAASRRGLPHLSSGLPRSNRGDSSSPGQGDGLPSLLGPILPAPIPLPHGPNPRRDPSSSQQGFLALGHVPNRLWQMDSMFPPT